METGRRLENKHAGSEMTKNEMQIQFTAVSENEAFARIAVAAFVTPLNPTLEEIADIKTAVSEAVTNAIIHGYDGMTGKEQNQVYIHCLLNRDVLQVEVIDEGKGIEDVEKAMEPMYTTSPISLTDGLERLLNWMKRFHVPVHELAMMMSIALRFIPTLIEETDKIMSAQKARGADFESGNLIQKAKALIPILVPLFISAFRRADELATAMECRCYHGGEGRTRLHVLRYEGRDITALCLGGAIMVGVIVMSRFGL